MYHQVWLISATSAAPIAAQCLILWSLLRPANPTATLQHARAQSAMNAADQLKHTPLPWAASICAASLYQALEFRLRQKKGDEVTSVR